jgi:hypothetical protein
MTLYQELDGLSLDELIQRLGGPPPDPEESNIYYEELAVRIQRFGEPGLRFLLDERAAVEQDEERLHALLLGLTFEQRDDAAVREILLRYLDDARPRIMMDAIDSLRYWRVSGAREHVSALAKHPSPYVGGGVVRYMAGLFANEARALLLAALRDEHCIVHESAVDAIDDEDVVELLPAVRPLLEDTHPHVRGAVQWALMDYAERMQYGGVDEEPAQECEANPENPG